MICLLSTRRFLTAAQIAATVPGYEHDADGSARARGVPAQVRAGQGRAARPRRAAGDRHHQRLRQRARLPHRPARLRAARRPPGAGRDGGGRHRGPAVAARRAGRGRHRPGCSSCARPASTSTCTATLGRRAGGHRRPGLRAAADRGPASARRSGSTTARPEDDAAQTRRLQPWGVVSWRGRWYVVGHDLDRDATRCFRLSRVVGAVEPVGAPGAFTPPADLDLISHVARWSGPVEHPNRATVLVRPGRAAGVRRRAEAVDARPGRRPGRCCATPTRTRSPAGSSGTAPTWWCSSPTRCARRSSPGCATCVETLAVDAGPAGRAPAAAAAGVSAARATAPAGGDRLARLLNLVPYLLARPGIPVAEAAADLGVSERQLREDLELLWVCGLPGYGPGDLIDMAFDGDRVTITYDAGIDRPLRLTQDEALALVVALRMLAQVPGRARTGTRSSGRWRRSSRRPATRPPGCRWRRALPGAGDGAAGRAAGRGAAPARAAADVLHRRPGTRSPSGSSTRCGCCVVGGRAYLEAWCRRAEAVRLFRVDRIDVVHRAGRAGRRRRPRPGPTDVSDGRLHARARSCRWSRCGSAAGRGGSPSTTRASRVVEESPDRWLVSLRASDLALGPPAGARAGLRGDRGLAARAGRGGPGRGPGGAGRVRRRRERADRSRTVAAARVGDVTWLDRAWRCSWWPWWCWWSARDVAGRAAAPAAPGAAPAADPGRAGAAAAGEPRRCRTSVADAAGEAPRGGRRGPSRCSRHMTDRRDASVDAARDRRDSVGTRSRGVGAGART